MEIQKGKALDRIVPSWELQSCFAFFGLWYEDFLENLPEASNRFSFALLLLLYKLLEKGKEMWLGKERTEIGFQTISFSSVFWVAANACIFDCIADLASRSACRTIFRFPVERVETRRSCVIYGIS